MWDLAFVLGSYKEQNSIIKIMSSLEFSVRGRYPETEDFISFKESRYKFHVMNKTVK